MKEWFYYKEAYEKTNKPMAQQTAVEWLNHELWSLRLQLRGGEISIEDFGKKMIVLLEQAKQMEKEQIMDAYNNGENRSAELYYKETYGK